MFRPLSLLLSLILAAPLVAQGEQCVVIGDSLTKEYEVEFPALFPNNPASWSARNWIEILHQRRTDWFDTGPFAQNNDPRIVGHEYNWAFPGATAAEIKSQLNNPLNFWWTDKVKNHLKNIAERVVIFAGGNDVDSYYGNIYNGATATTYTNATRDNLQWIVDWVRAQKSTLPIVLVAVPHLGCAPDIQLQCPTDPVKTGRVTAALDALNGQLATFAQSRGIGFAAGVYDVTKKMIDEPFRIGGIEIYKQGDMDARPRFLFSGDNFHPNTCAHARIAQIIIDTFRAKYPAIAINPLGDREIVTQVLFMNPHIPFAEWIATQAAPPEAAGLFDDPDGDGLKNAVEFAIPGQSAGASGPAPFAEPVLEMVDQQPYLVWNYQVNPVAAEWAVIRPQSSPDLLNWQDIPPAQVTTQPDGAATVRVPTAGPLFFRVNVRP